jgi:murein DD-endopeptidase MepM/ murein hydrolase activator NlpD
MGIERSGWGSRLFPEIRSCFAAKSSVMLPRWPQVALLSIGVAGAAALSYLSVNLIGYRHLVAKRDATIAQAQTTVAQAQTVNAELQRGVIRLQSQLAALAQRQTAAEARASSEDRSIAELSRTLDQTRQSLHQQQAAAGTLTAQLAKSQAGRTADQAQFAQYRASIEDTVKQLEQLGAPHGKMIGNRIRLRARLGGLWQKLSQEIAPAAGQVAASSPAQGPSTDDVASIGEPGPEEISRFEHFLASAGVDTDRLSAQLAGPQAEGGPFVPPPKLGQPSGQVDPKKLEAIRGLAKVLPLAAPLIRYQIGSPFGPRTDPFNRKPAFHTGIDMDAPYMSPVYATAPGTVVYAGYFGEYGRVIEIDHGFGIQTVYAHLQRCFVAVGQQVSAQSEIGLVGTTGRSSGPHVHYEVRVNGQPQDPEKFIEFSHLVPIAAPQLSPEAAAPAGSSR